MKREETVDHHIKSAWHAISRMYNQKAAQEDFTTAMGFVLININSKEGTAATKIAPLIGLEARSLTRMLKTMEEKGFIFKKADPNDKRSVRIFLTPEGKRKKAISVETIKNFNLQVRELASESELEIFYSVFQKINKVIENIQSEPINPNSYSDKVYEL
ncbi:MarR family transcriptional regulator [Rhodonellum psychrophilum GCM71 = DSM 17998]|uniref:MarR family transcriptional regulator n=2 Tax=Rhodonellum TaxID=336827 RepID=U5C073_9BACT|nr:MULTISPECIES: MarR family transcriptional regulator [Rhodonellum]ERM83473.1 MarR family transcriptional regulator [Rhodonellum psychrophilum GCM71 = DSM 17998]MDO9552639.1 MarR family transcriptional regulator [Rhodonellum sp.]SDY43421.1 DNA-binding transcriptional regulator, MarR family [Rhodonellum ikkaensis]